MLLSTGRNFLSKRKVDYFVFKLKWKVKSFSKGKKTFWWVRLMTIREDKENGEITILEILTEIMNGCFSWKFEIFSYLKNTWQMTWIVLSTIPETIIWSLPKTLKKMISFNWNKWNAELCNVIFETPMRCIRETYIL